MVINGMKRTISENQIISKAEQLQSCIILTIDVHFTTHSYLIFTIKTFLFSVAEKQCNFI